MTSYSEYLTGIHWADLRERKLKEHGRYCARCKSGHHLQVHHKIYRARWEDALMDDLEVLCRTCHRIEHGFQSDQDPKKRKLMARKAIHELMHPNLEKNRKKRLSKKFRKARKLWIHKRQEKNRSGNFIIGPDGSRIYKPVI